MNFTPEMLNAAKNAKTAEELMLLAKENNIEATEEEIKAYFEANNKTGELADDELDNVAGGGCGGGGGESAEPDWRDSYYDGMYLRGIKPCTELTHSVECQNATGVMIGHFYYTNKEEQSWKVVCEKCGRAFRGMYHPAKLCPGRQETFHEM